MKIGFNMLLWTTNLVEDQFDLLKRLKMLVTMVLKYQYGGEESFSFC